MRKIISVLFLLTCLAVLPACSGKKEIEPVPAVKPEPEQPDTPDAPDEPEPDKFDPNAQTWFIAASPEAGQQLVRVTPAFVNTSVPGYGDAEALVDREAWQYEIFTQLEVGGKFYFRTEDDTLYALGADGRVAQIHSTDEIAWPGVTREGVYRMRIDFKSGYASVRRVESVRLNQPARGGEINLAYAGRGCWKKSDFVIWWKKREDWGAASQWQYKFQLYFNETNTWQHYGLREGMNLQTFTGDFWQGCFDAPEALRRYVGGNDNKATVALYLNAEKGYCHEFTDIRDITPEEAGTGGKMLFDFGNTANAATSVPTASPDKNGNNWNNIEISTNGGNVSGNGKMFENLVYADSTVSGYSLVLTTDFRSNGSQNGGLTEAMYSDQTTAALGELAIGSATQDYFHIDNASTVSTFELRGLNPANAYVFRFFGSRTATADGMTRYARYSVSGSNSYSGQLLITGPENGAQNKDKVLVSTPVFPSAEGVLTVSLAKGSTTNGDLYQLNCMSVEEFVGGDVPEAVSYVSLEATSSEETFPMRRRETSSHIFDGVSSFTGGQSVPMSAVDARGQTHSFTATATVDGPAYFVADLDNDSYTFTAIPSLSPEGNAVNGFGVSGPAIAYAGKGVFKGEILPFNGTSEGNADAMTPTYPFSRYGRARYTFYVSGNRDLQFRRVQNRRHNIDVRRDGVTEGSEMQINPGVYDITVNLRDFTYSVTPKHDASNRITVMGSSVPFGTGATDNKGYMYLYATRALTDGWLISNQSIGGNKTTDLLARYDDLQTDGGKYVIYALSMGNEGIHGASDQEAVFNQWQSNMQTLIARAREEGRTVVLTNNYARGDFNASDYGYVKRMNLDIHQWDVPSANLLGAIDNGEGHWADGYQNGSDVYHPDTKGHQEMSYTLVPSLFDALKAGKALPTRQTGGSCSLSGSSLSFAPEATVHSFTLAFYVRTSAQTGTLATIDGASRTLSLSEGRPVCGQLASTVSVADGQWHLVALSHHYARGASFLYVDGVLQGQTVEQLVPTEFRFGAVSAEIRELFFWRSGMNADEMNALQEGKMLKSSLEIYAPLIAGSKENLAQSTNVLR